MAVDLTDEVDVRPIGSKETRGLDDRPLDHRTRLVERCNLGGDLGKRPLSVDLTAGALLRRAELIGKVPVRDRRGGVVGQCAQKAQSGIVETVRPGAVGAKRTQHLAVRQERRSSHRAHGGHLDDSVGDRRVTEALIAPVVGCGHRLAPRHRRTEDSHPDLDAQVADAEEVCRGRGQPYVLDLDAAVAGAAGDFHVDEPGLSEQALNQSLECSRIELLRQHVVQVCSPRVHLLGSVIVAIAVSICLTASPGLGGSLLLVPTLALAMGPKSGVALAALLLAGNNMVKVWAYRVSLPIRSALPIVGLTALGALLGARLLIALPESVITAAILVAFTLTLVAERLSLAKGLRLGGAPGLALAAGATSGLSGTSGPLKGVAIRSLGLDRFHIVGAASLVSLAGDATKTAAFAEARLLDHQSFMLAVTAVPLMVVATYVGRRINRELGERGYAMLFWGVIGGYAARLVLNVKRLTPRADVSPRLAAWVAVLVPAARPAASGARIPRG
jgi:uncharacterized protein